MVMSHHHSQVASTKNFRFYFRNCNAAECGEWISALKDKDCLTVWAYDVVVAFLERLRNAVTSCWFATIRQRAPLRRLVKLRMRIRRNPRCCAFHAMSGLGIALHQSRSGHTLRAGLRCVAAGSRRRLAEIESRPVRVENHVESVNYQISRMG